MFQRKSILNNLCSKLLKLVVLAVLPYSILAQGNIQKVDINFDFPLKSMTSSEGSSIKPLNKIITSVQSSGFWIQKVTLRNLTKQAYQSLQKDTDKEYENQLGIIVARPYYLDGEEKNLTLPSGTSMSQEDLTVLRLLAIKEEISNKRLPTDNIEIHLETNHQEDILKVQITGRRSIKETEVSQVTRQRQDIAYDNQTTETSTREDKSQKKEDFFYQSQPELRRRLNKFSYIPPDVKVFVFRYDDFTRIRYKYVNLASNFAQGSYSALIKQIRAQLLSIQRKHKKEIKSIRLLTKSSDPLPILNSGASIEYENKQGWGDNITIAYSLNDDYRDAEIRTGFITILQQELLKLYFLRSFLTGTKNPIPDEKINLQIQTNQSEDETFIEIEIEN